MLKKNDESYTNITICQKFYLTHLLLREIVKSCDWFRKHLRKNIHIKLKKKC